MIAVGHNGLCMFISQCLLCSIFLCFLSFLCFPIHSLCIYFSLQFFFFSFCFRFWSFLNWSFCYYEGQFWLLELHFFPFKFTSSDSNRDSNSFLFNSFCSFLDIFWIDYFYIRLSPSLAWWSYTLLLYFRYTREHNMHS